jgi:hypothetical protein
MISPFHQRCASCWLTIRIETPKYLIMALETQKERRRYDGIVRGTRMHIIVAVDWRDQSQSALQEIVDLYQPDELSLVHAVNFGALESPPIASVTDHKAYQEFERAKRRFMDQEKEQLQQLVARVQREWW